MAEALRLVGQHRHRHAAGELDRLGIRGPERRGHDHFVARIAQRRERVVDGLLAAVGDEHLRGGHLVARVALGLDRERLAQFGQARRRRVAVVLRVAAAAATAASTMASGVGKSGSPAPKPTTSSPAATIALALASMASVADGATAAIRRDRRFTAVMLAEMSDDPRTRYFGPRRTCFRSTGGSAQGPPKSARPRPTPSPRAGTTLLGTSHRQAPVKNLVGTGARRPVARCSSCPTATRCCSATAAPRCSGMRPRSASSRTRASTSASASSRPSSPSAAKAAPFLDEPAGHRGARRHPRRRGRHAGHRPVRPHAQRNVDRRRRPDRAPDGRRRRRDRRRRRHLDRRRHRRRSHAVRLLLLRAAEVLRAPTAASGSPLCSPAAIERIERISASGRWIPAILDLQTCVTNSRAQPDAQHAGASPR